MTRLGRVDGRLLKLVEHEETLVIVIVVHDRHRNRGGWKPAEVRIANERRDAVGLEGNAQALR